jgi:hypothetical protein
MAKSFCHEIILPKVFSNGLKNPTEKFFIRWVFYPREIHYVFGLRAPPLSGLIRIKIQSMFFPVDEHCKNPTLICRRLQFPLPRLSSKTYHNQKLTGFSILMQLQKTIAFAWVRIGRNKIGEAGSPLHHLGKNANKLQSLPAIGELKL